MYSGFTTFDIVALDNVTIHGVQGGSGSYLLLLYGFPQDHHIWHPVAMKLASSYTAIAIGLRGYGASSAPKGSETHVEYSRIMARDCALLIAARGITNYSVCGHDRGARVAHKLCIDYPDNVSRIVFLDIYPALAMYANIDKEFANAYYHWFGLTQPAPELLVEKIPQLMK